MKYTIIAIVLAVAVVLSVFFLVKSTKSPADTAIPSVSNTQKPVEQTKPNQSTTSDSASQQAGDSKAQASKISKTELTALFAASPASGASKDEYQTYFKRVLEASVSATVLDVTGCAPKPNLIHFKEKQAITFENRDSAAHVLTNGPGKTVIATIPANSSKEIVPTSGQGLIGYACDGVGPVGGMFVD